jgi:hypothetical protein
MAHVHTWQSTTADGWRQCSGCKIVQRQIDGQWKNAMPRKKRQDDWNAWAQSEYNLLNQTQSYDTADYEKARRDSRNYWR